MQWLTSKSRYLPSTSWWLVVAVSVRKGYHCGCDYHMFQLLWVFNFANFQSFAKLIKKKIDMSTHILTTRVSMDNMGLTCQICKEHSPKRWFWSRHCFADSCKLKWTTVWLCVLDRTRLVCHTHTTYITCMWFRQWIYFNEIFENHYLWILRPSTIQHYTI